LVIWLDRPRLVCLWRGLSRVFRSGEAHKLKDLLKVLRFTWNFDKVNRPRLEVARLAHGPNVPVIRLRSDREVASFLEAQTPR